jgi:nitrite reductase/ring-hydroxylating ferredoxin subunit
MHDTMSAAILIARRDELRPGQTKKFLLECGGREVEAFLLNHAGSFHAYVNQCRHVPMNMDWVENQFFSEDGCHVLCATHGALYEPDSGECVAGPPLGKRLIRVPLAFAGEEIYASCPQAD